MGLELTGVFAFIDLPQPACQDCPAVHELPSLKTLFDSFCLSDFGE